ncbi:uncharacterized protein LOC134270764 [Saccostrea cucullata]|uniref:uncharacterized protein LOC134270764 n=1 Tax=Saccostrea cuccullata TaxID=36930 RepID=UPI002ED6AAE8
MDDKYILREILGSHSLDNTFAGRNNSPVYLRGTERPAYNNESYHFRDLDGRDRTDIRRNSSFLARVLDGTIALEARRWLGHQLRAKYPDGTSCNSPPPKPNHDQSLLKSKECHTVGFVILGVLLVAVAGGSVMVYVGLLSPFTDDTVPKECNQTLPRFGNNCEFRCHCANLSEVCNKLTGSCQSGCIDGWRGNDCQMITSVFDKSTIHANLSSQELVQCTIHKLWYNWSSVYLTFYNGTETTTLIRVSENGDKSISDHRLNATLSRAPGIEADNVTFAFDIGADDCDLAGNYECRFDIVDNFTASYGNLTLSVHGISFGLQIATNNEYYNGSTDYINCSVQLADPSSNIVLTFIDRDNTTLNLSSVQVHQLMENSLPKCTNMTTFVFEINAANEMNQSKAKCSLLDSSGKMLESNGSIINIVSKSASVYSMFESTSYVVRPQSSFDVVCYIFLVETEWESISLKRYTNQSEELVKMFRDGSMINIDNRISPVYTDGSSSVNVTFSFNLTNDPDQCSLSAIYGCEFQTSEHSESISFSNTSIAVVAPLSSVDLSLETFYVSGTNFTVNCTADVGNVIETEVTLEKCLEGGKYTPVREEARDILTTDDAKGVNCTNKMTYRYHIPFMDNEDGMSVRCHGRDNVYSKNVPTSCASINVTKAHATLDPKVLYGKFNSTATFQCRIPLLESYFSEFQFFNDSSHPILSINSDNNVTPPLQNDRVSAVYISNQYDEYRAVNFTFDLRSGDEVCSFAGVYRCKVKSFNESLLSLEDDESQLIIAAPPSNITIEIKDTYSKGGINETINCTATLNPNTTTLTLVRLFNETYTMVPKNITKTSMETARTDDCRYDVQVTVTTTFDQFDRALVACLAKDVVFGDYFSVNKTITIV